MNNAMKKPGFLRVLAWLLVIACLLTNVPATVFAADAAPDTGAQDGTTETVPATTETVPATTETVPATTETVPATTETVPETTAASVSAGGKLRTAAPVASGSGDGGAIELSGYTRNLNIFSQNAFNLASDSTPVANAASGYTLTGTAAYDIVIGDRDASYTDEISAPVNADISVVMNSVTVGESKSVTVRKVYDGANRVIMTTQTREGTDGNNQPYPATSISTLTVEEYAKLTLTLADDTTITALNLGEDSELVINTNGYTLTVGSISGLGNVTINGGTVKCGTIDVQNLTVDGATLDAGGSGTITADDAIALNNATVNNAALLGFNASSYGTNTLTMTGSNSFSTVTTVGAGNGCASVVSISGAAASTLETTFVSDYTITYQHGSATLTPADSWPVAYRVSNNAIIGSVSKSGYTAGSSVTLPEYADQGYEYAGWVNGEDAITAISSVLGNVELTLKMTAGAVVVTYDLGYTPSQYTNDDYTTIEKTTTDSTSIGETITLAAPSQGRFGYEFAGWEITTGENAGEIITGTTYAVSYASVEEAGAGGYLLNLTAVWTPKQYKVRLQLDVTVDEAYVLISTTPDDADSWMTIADFAAEKAQYVSWDAVNKTLSFMDGNGNDKLISYDTETLAEYFEAIGGYPYLMDTREGETARRQFTQWGTRTGTLVDENTKYVYAEGSFLDGRGTATLEEYEQTLVQAPITLMSKWEVVDYTLTTDVGMNWTIYVDDDATDNIPAVMVTPDENGQITVKQGYTVTYVYPENTTDLGFTLWSLGLEKNGAWEYGQIAVDASANTGDLYERFSFVMPAGNVAAAYYRNDARSSDEGTKLLNPTYDEAWVDLSGGDITFAKNVTYRGYTKSGFYHQKYVPSMTPWFYDEAKGQYFYAWDIRQGFYVTTNNVATANQLTLAEGMTVNLRECVMTATSDFAANAKGTCLGPVNLMQCVTYDEVPTNASYDQMKVQFADAGIDVADYGNIVLNTEDGIAYTTNLVLHGKNTITAIVQDDFTDQKTFYSLNIKEASGAEAELELGAIIGGMQMAMSDIVVNEQDNGFDYIVYSTIGEARFVSTTLNAPDKIASARSILGVSGTGKAYVREVFAGNRISATEDGYLRVCGDVIYGYGTVYLKDNASIVIDGNLMPIIQNYQSSDMVINTTGYLIVKGNRCDISRVDWKGGTLICNALVVGKEFNFEGGTIIANQLMSSPVKFPRYKAGEDGSWSLVESGENTGYTMPARENGDCYPFLVYAQDTGGIFYYQISGSANVNLLGYYKANLVDGEFKYDTSIAATDAGNPVSQVISAVIDPATGDLAAAAGADAVSSALETAKAAAAANYSGNECVVLGDSTHSHDSASSSTFREVEITGGSLWAAGNVTFRNDTTVSGGTVTCGGTFGTKGNLTLSGGSVTASQVGNAYISTKLTSDGFTQWKTTTIDGGTVNSNTDAPLVIGALTQASDGTESGTVIPQGTLIITDGSNIPAGTKLTHDVYVNYVDGNLFTSEDLTNPQSVRFEATWADGNTVLADAAWAITEEAVFQAPPKKNDAEASGIWKLEVISGPEVAKIDENNDFLDGNGAVSTDASAYDRLQIPLYAVSNVNRLQIMDGAEYVTKVTAGPAGGEQVELTFSDDNSAEVPGGYEVTVTVSNEILAKDKTVIWYQDGTGQVFNLVGDTSLDGNTITFTMPTADAEVYVTDEITLDLYSHDIAVTADGFRTAWEEGDPAKTFHYTGSIRISQSNVPDTVWFNAYGSWYDGTQPVRPCKDATSKVAVISSASVAYFAMNRILFEDDFDNTDAGDRKVTLEHVLQKGADYDAGVKLEVGAQVVLTIDGPNQVHLVEVPQGSYCKIAGAQGTSTNDSADSDVLCFYPSTAATQARNNALFGNWYGTAGEMVLENLRIALRSTNSGILGYSGNVADAANNETTSITYRGVSFTHPGLWVASGLAHNLTEVNIENCNFDLQGDDQYPGSLFNNCDYVNIDNSTIYYKDLGGSGTRAFPFFYGIMKEANINNSNITLTGRYSTSTVKYLESQGADQTKATIYVNSGTNLVTPGHIRLNALVVNGGTMTVGADGKGYLFCPEVTVESGTLNAGGIVAAGYYAPANYDGIEVTVKTQTTFNAHMAAGRYVQDGTGYSGLVINGGEVNADFVGGDVNGKVTVNGGTLNASRIGTRGGLLGYTLYIGQNVDYYEYAKIPVGATVTINGGEVNVTDGGYLGGMKSTVNVTGGTVNLGENTTLGMTETQKATLEADAANQGGTVKNAVAVNVSGGLVTMTDGTNSGSISAPYGTVTVSGSDTAVHVKDMTALNGGTITISDAHTGLSNPYGGLDKAHDQVGVKVELLEAEQVNILNNAVVYAKNADSATKAGSLQVGTVEKPNAHLYTQNYNETGAVVEGENSKIYGTQTFSITYVLNDDTLDPATNSANNPTSYIYGSTNADGDTQISLEDPTRYGYNFLGWYVMSGEEEVPLNGVLTTALQTNYTVYAKWEPKTVTFTVTIPASVFGDNAAAEFEGLAGTNADGVFTFNETFTVPYRGLIVGSGEGTLDFEKYLTNSYVIQQLQIRDTYLDSIVVVSGNDTTIDKAILDAYTAKVTAEGADATLNLEAVRVAKNVVNLTLYANRNTSGKPSSVSYNYTTAPQTVRETFVRSSVDIDKTVAQAQGFVTAAGSLIAASAPGYTFHGWFVNEDGTGIMLAQETVITQDMPSDYYASWTPNTYTIQFNSDGGAITTTDAQPAGGESAALNATVVYDTVINGGMTIGSTGSQSLPYAWKEGYIFNGWTFEGANGTVIKADDTTTVLCKEVFGDALNTDANETTVALTLTADYTPVTVSYDLNGGAWVNADAVDTTPAYGAPLAGYATATNGGIVSTSAAEFATSHTYVDGDYRETLVRKGYTFAGWLDENGVEYYTIPKYENVAVTAKWTPNTYTLNLHSGTNAESVYADYNPTGENKTGITVKVGQEVSADVAGVNVTNWPARSDWYAYNEGEDPTDENAKRYLLGFTFDMLDPGNTDTANTAGYAVYNQYAEDITELLNSGAIHSKQEASTAGTVFGLPEDADYTDLVTGATSVPDYPDGSTIDMYAVYRERSLVFVEYVQKADGTSKTVLYSAPWNTFSNYPFDASNGYPALGNEAALNAEGYYLIGWRINGTNYTDPAYTDETTYEANKETYKTKAETLGTYDIMVYTLYAAQVKDTKAALTASTDPTAASGSTYNYTLPGSIQEGKLRYEFANLDGLTVVKKADLEKFDEDTANNTVAIQVTLTDTNGATYGPYDLETAGAGNTIGTVAVGAGWKVSMTLYHSSVMSQEVTYPIDLKLTFDNDDNAANDNPLSNQHVLFEGLDVKLQPSEYEVTYVAQVPDALTPTTWNGFDTTTKTQVKTVAYGSATLAADQIPVIPGYSAGDWTNATETIALGGALKLTADEAADGKVTLTTDYTINNHSLTADSKTLELWTVKAGSSNLTDAGLNVPYGTTVTFTGKSGADAQFITLEIAGQEPVRLDKYTSNTNTFTMPDADVHAIYQDTKVLYLENGNISITASGYTQSGGTVELDEDWTGNYLILQNADDDASEATAYTLSLSGDLTGQAINLGSLNISSANSIALDTTAKANLTLGYEDTAASLTAKNVLVPYGAVLTMTNVDPDAKADVSLAPAAGSAAIGGKGDKNGQINLDNLNLTMELTAPSAASGIGSGSQSAGGDAVTIRDSAITVKQVEAAVQVYQGAWIGGNAVESVTLTNTTVTEHADSKTMIGPKAVDGDTVTLTDSKIGTSDAPVTVPVNAGTKLALTNAEVYQAGLRNQTPIGTDATGTIEVTGSTVQADAQDAPALYTGTMKIYDAASDVMLGGTQIVEMSNGDVTITDTSITQDSSTHDHAGDYLLLHEITDTNAGDLTVNSLAADASVTVNAMEIGKITANGDTEIDLAGDVTVNGTVTIADGKTLTVDGGESTLTLTSVADSEGTFVQENGNLNAGSAFDCAKLDVTLKNVTTTAADLVAENLTLIGGTVTATGNVGSEGVEGGVTTVKLDGARVEAERVGALGEQGKTFTFVELQNNYSLSADTTLVRDHYRLAYNVSDKYTTDSLPATLRTETTAGETTYLPRIPDAPDYTGEGTSRFGCWYLLDADGNKVALSQTDVPGFDKRQSALIVQNINWAEPAADDGTRTLNLYAHINVTAEAAIQAGRTLDPAEFTGTGAAVSVTRADAWTAKFTVSGSLEDSTYQLALDQAFPAGTKLTLWLDDANGIGSYYHYTCTGSETVIALNSFTAIGGTSKAALTSTGDETVLYLAAQFPGVGTATDTAVKLQLVTGTDATDLASVTYSLTDAPSASVTADADTVTVDWSGDGAMTAEKLFLVAEITGGDIAYGAKVTLDDAAGTRIGRNQILFTLGDADTAIDGTVYAWAIEGLDAGEYTVTWHLTAAPAGNDNVMGGLLASATPVSHEVEAPVAPEMDIMSISTDSRVLTAGTENTVTITLTSNGGVEALAEVQSAILASFGETDDVTCAVTGSDDAGYTATVTFAASAAPGTYRICFSMDDPETGSANDNVYAAFILEAAE